MRREGWAEGVVPAVEEDHEVGASSSFENGLVAEVSHGLCQRLECGAGGRT